MSAVGNNGRNKQKIALPSSIKDGWFSETEPMWPGQKLSIALEEFSEDKSVLFYEKSQFQSIMVFRSAQHGNVLVLDGVIQLTENDEFAYQEMITHLPMFAHHNPQNVLIVGGGDGGVLREVCRHDCVQEITMVEIDEMVIEVSKRYFSESTATSFGDKRLTLIHEDAAEFLRRHNSNPSRRGYDVILADSSDPVGPAETLFDPAFYEQMHSALNEGCVIAAQLECFWTHSDLIMNVVACCADIFDTVDYASTMVPTYPCGQIGFLLAGKGENAIVRRPQREIHKSLQCQLQWYTPAIHTASFILPKFIEDRLVVSRPSPMIFDVDDNTDEQHDCFLSRCTIS